MSSTDINGVLYKSASEDYFGNPRPNPADTCVDIGAIESTYGRVTSLEKSLKLLPQKFALYQNYPNPFNPKTSISWQLPVSSRVDLSIYNILGQKVCTLVSEKQKAGIYKVEWDATGFSSGIYIYQLRTKGQQNTVFTKKLVLLK